MITMCLHLSMARNSANTAEPQVTYSSALRSKSPSISLILAALPVASHWKFPINFYAVLFCIWHITFHLQDQNFMTV